jgi:hypothetical protein
MEATKPALAQNINELLPKNGRSKAMLNRKIVFQKAEWHGRRRPF